MKLKKFFLVAVMFSFAQVSLAQTDGSVVFEGQQITDMVSAANACNDEFAAGELQLKLKNIPYTITNRCTNLNYERTKWFAQIILQDTNISVQEFKLAFASQAACTKNLTDSIDQMKKQALVVFMTKRCSYGYDLATGLMGYSAKFVVLNNRAPIVTCK